MYILHMRLPTEVIVDGHSRVLDTVLCLDGCAVNLNVDLLCHRPGCSPAKAHDLGLAIVRQFIGFNPGSNEL